MSVSFFFYRGNRRAAGVKPFFVSRGLSVVGAIGGEEIENLGGFVSRGLMFDAAVDGHTIAGA
jgi:hypothetical protein